MADKFKVLVFTWNVGGISLCETDDQLEADYKRTKLTNFKGKCTSSQFFDPVSTEIVKSQPGLVAISTQNEPNSDSHFHSIYLPNAMGNLGFTALKRERVTGPDGSVRMSIFVRNDEHKHITNTTTEMLNKTYGQNGQRTVRCKIGTKISEGIGAYVYHEHYGHFAFAAIYIPDGVKKLNVGDNLSPKVAREAIKAANKICLIGINNWLQLDSMGEYAPDYVFLFGDFNYNIEVGKATGEQVTGKYSTTAISNFRGGDELAQAMKEIPLKGYLEGIDDNGPEFEPTFNHLVGRPSSCYTKKGLGETADTCFESGEVGWRDRILFKEPDSNTSAIHCTKYERVDNLQISNSNHTAVIGCFNISRNF